MGGRSIPPRRAGSRAVALALLLVLGTLLPALAGCGPAATISPGPSASPGPTPTGSAASPTSSARPSPAPSPSGAAPASPAGPTTTPTARPSGFPSASPSTIVHVVAPGDTLSSLARRYDTTARSIAFWNRATYPSLDPTSPAYDPDRLMVGWRLVVHPGTVVDETDPPPGPATPRPSPATPRPSPRPTPTPTPRPDDASVVVVAGPRDRSQVALTFDMGGRLDPALAIVDWLVGERVPATIFPTGSAASTTATGRAVLDRIAAHPALLSLGNHTWDHPDLTGLDAAAIADQLGRTEAAVAERTGRTTRPFFRPPYGAHDAEVRAVAGRLGWRYTVMWDVDTIDWKRVEDGGPTADEIVARVVSRARGGSIVLMHLGGYHTLEALPEVVQGLRDRGLEPVTLETMLGG